MSRYLIIGLLVSFVWCGDALAQGSLKDKVRNGLQRGANKETKSDSNDSRFDFEGVVWEFKVIDRKEKDKSKQTKMTGRLRIKQSAIFAIGNARKTDSASDSSDAKTDNASDLKGQFKGALSRRFKNAGENSNDERVGDLSKKSASQYVFQFDQDDDYPLSGRAELKPDSKNKGGVWYGKYVEYLKGNKKKSWRMELRKIDE